MRTLLMWGLIVAFPFFCFAQGEQTVSKDFEKKVLGLASTFRINEHISVAQTQVDDDNFSLTAVDDKLQVIWRISLPGKKANSGMFKDNILATARVSSGKSKKDPDDYFAYLIDAQTGKLLLKKQVYQGTAENYEDMETLFANDGSWARLLVRQTAASRKARFLKIDEVVETKSFIVIDLNDKLDPVLTQYNIPNGVYIGFVSNSADSFYVVMFEPGQAFKVLKFTDGKPEVAAMITKEMDLPKKLYSPKLTAKCISSAKDMNVVYLAADYKGSDDFKLAICKFDFGNNSSKVVNEIITREHIRDIKKKVDETYKKIGDLSFGGKVFDFEVKNLADFGGTITVSFGDHWDFNNYQIEGSTIINGYDEDLNQKFQQVMASNTVYGPSSDVATVYYYS
ncbi:MAG: hypothetical protein ACTHJ8_18715, partial [Mucilaginibacter sp.]